MSMQTLINLSAKALIAAGVGGRLSDESYPLAGSVPNDQEPSTNNRGAAPSPVRGKIDCQPPSATEMKDGALDAKMAQQTWADITKANRVLGWSPRMSLGEGFQRALDWHVGAHDWLKAITL